MGRISAGLEGQRTLCKNATGDWVSHPKIARGGRVEIRVLGEFADVWRYYANLVDYLRIGLAFAACALIVIDNAKTGWISALIMASVLLDWVDGPLARRYGQSTTIGCGMDWLADLAAQFAIALWALELDIPGAAYFVLFFFVELSVALFDFALSTVNIYPARGDSSKISLLLRVEHWLTPNDRYSTLGTACWLANTALPLGLGLRFPVFVSLALVPLAFLYAWHELCQLGFVLRNWKETAAEPLRGIHAERQCTEAERRLLEACWQETEQRFAKSRPENSAIYWHNLYINQAQTTHSPVSDGVYDFVETLLTELYPREKRVILSYGFIISPANSSENQGWHFDYSPEVSNIFIPLTPVTQKNATQFIENILKSEMSESNYFPPPAQLLEKEDRLTLKVSQVVSAPFVIMKLQPGTCHRGIRNQEEYDRILFFVSTNKDVFIDIGEKDTYSESEYGDLDRLKDD